MIDNVNQCARHADRPVTGAEDNASDGISPEFSRQAAGVRQELEPKLAAIAGDEFQPGRWRRSHAALSLIRPSGRGFAEPGLNASQVLDVVARTVGLDAGDALVPGRLR